MYYNLWSGTCKCTSRGYRGPDSARRCLDIAHLVVTARQPAQFTRRADIDQPVHHQLPVALGAHPGYASIGKNKATGIGYGVSNSGRSAHRYAVDAVQAGTQYQPPADIDGEAAGQLSAGIALS